MTLDPTLIHNEASSDSVRSCALPPPWTVGGYFYYGEEAGRRTAANLLTKDEARGRPVNFAKLPELLQRH